MKKQLNGIILVLFGILLCLASNELNTTIFRSWIDMPFALLGVIFGIVGIIILFMEPKNK